MRQWGLQAAPRRRDNSRRMAGAACLSTPARGPRDAASGQPLGRMVPSAFDSPREPLLDLPRADAVGRSAPSDDRTLLPRADASLAHPVASMFPPFGGDEAA